MEWKNTKKFFHTSRHTYEVNSLEELNDVTCPGKIKEGLKEPRIKVRHLVIILAFMAEFVFYYQQITMSVSLVAMVNQSSLPQLNQFTTAKSCPINTMETKNSSTKKIMHAEGEFSWSPKIQGYLLMSSFLCYMIFLPIFSKLAEIYGGKIILFWSLFLASVFIFISPFAARWSVYALISIQGLRGLSQSGIVPTESVLVANWFPKQERGFAYSFILSGCSFGAFFGSYLSGLLCDTAALGGWPSAFFVSGGIGFIVSMLILFKLHDNPSVHPKISEVERQYIFNNQENILTEKRPKTPWKELFRSVPVYALAFAYFGQIWAISFFMSVYPTYLSTILHYSAKESGLFAALPFLSSFLVEIACCFVSKLQTDSNCMTVDHVRKFWNFFSCIGLSACILGIYFSECSKMMIIIISLLVSVFFGSSTVGCWIVCTDMSPTFAASINSVAITVGNMGYIILPVTVGYLTDGMQTLEQWHKIFIISIAIISSSALVFAVFGSAKIQPWNNVPKNIEDELREESG